MIVVLAGAGEDEPVQGLICRKSYAAADAVPARQVIAVRQIGWFDGWRLRSDLRSTGFSGFCSQICGRVSASK
jgi:hypothetical protein